MAKSKRRSRNIASTPKVRSGVSGAQTVPPPAEPQPIAPNPIPEADHQEPQGEPGFVPQNSATPSESGHRDNRVLLPPDPEPLATHPGLSLPPDSVVSHADTNRQNAEKSTGPRTPEGKARSALNALNLGLSIQRHVVLPFEDPAQYAALRDSILAIYEPQSAREVLAVDDIAQCRWAFRRFDEAEATAIAKATHTWVYDHEQPTTVGEGLGFMAEPLGFMPDDTRYEDPSKPRIQVDSPCWKGFQHLHRYRTWWERKHQRALAEFERARQALRQQALDARTGELHQLRLESATRKRQREEAAERRREELHTLRIAREQEVLRKHHAEARAAEMEAEFQSFTAGTYTAIHHPNLAPAQPQPEFVSQNAGSRSGSTPQQMQAIPQEAVGTPVS